MLEVKVGGGSFAVLYRHFFRRNLPWSSSGDNRRKRHDGGGSPRRPLARLRRRLPWISAPEGWKFQDLMLVFVYR